MNTDTLAAIRAHVEAPRRADMEVCDACLGGPTAITPAVPWPAHAPDCEIGMLAGLLARVGELERATRTRPDYDLRCDACGAPHWLDTSLSSEVWNTIARRGQPDEVGLLCLLCIDERMEAAGLTDEAEFYFVGGALKSKLYAESRGCIADLERRLTAADARAGRLREALGRVLEWVDSAEVRGALQRDAGMVLHHRHLAGPPLSDEFLARARETFVLARAALASDAP